MSEIRVEESHIIDATPPQVYALLSDYRHGHPAILPKAYFQSIAVEQGGQGAGTVVRTRMSVMGAQRTFHLVVSEPEPGRVLVEEDGEAGAVTSFTVDPVDDGQRSKVTIATNARVSPGARGWLERLINPFILSRIYRQELSLLAQHFDDAADDMAAGHGSGPGR